MSFDLDVFINKAKYNLINKIHKHSLRIVYEMEDANFENLLIKDSSWTIQENHISPLNHINPSIMQEFLHYGPGSR